MNVLFLAPLALASLLLSYVLTRLIEVRSSRLGLVQNPNARSSHSNPTPSGGGVGPAIVGVLASLLIAAAGHPLFGLIAALAGAAAALVFTDDLRDLPARIRFAVQAILLAALVFALWPLPPLALPGGLLAGGAVLAVFVVIGGLWWINLFNFMDGIDGIAASQAILILLGAAGIGYWRDAGIVQTPIFALMVLVAATALGFLARNWPPAKIFMGDAGSNFYAFAILAVALLTISSGTLDYPAWLILICVFATDAGVTLIRRLAHGEKPWQAHRRHAYQQLSRRWSHQSATLLYAALTALLALPCAWAASAFPAYAWVLVAAAYLPMLALVLWAGAGSRIEFKRN